MKKSEEPAHTDIEAIEVKDGAEKHQNGTSGNGVMPEDRKGMGMGRRNVDTLFTWILLPQICF